VLCVIRYAASGVIATAPQKLVIWSKLKSCAVTVWIITEPDMITDHKKYGLQVLGYYYYY